MTFLKYAGSKRASIPQLLRDLPQFWRYYEPFLGGGSLLFALAARGLQLHGSDVNSRLIVCYTAVRDMPEKVAAELAWHQGMHSQTHYYAIRDRFNDRAQPAHIVAADFIYLNKTGFNGLYRENRSGGFNVPWGKRERFNPPDIAAVSWRLQGVELNCSSWEASLAAAHPSNLVYCDPPFVKVAKSGGFDSYVGGAWTHSDLQRLAKAADQARQRGVHVMLSNHDTEEVRDLFARWNIETTHVTRPINSNGSGRGVVPEIIIRSWG